MLLPKDTTACSNCKRCSSGIFRTVTCAHAKALHAGPVSKQFLQEVRSSNDKAIESVFNSKLTIRSCGVGHCTAGRQPAMQDADDAVETLRQYCLAALTEKATGTSSKGYLSLLERVKALKQATRQQAQQGAPEHLQYLGAFVALLKGLTQCVSAIHERKHEQLVREVLDVQLWRVHQAVRAAVLDFVTFVMVANGALVQSCLQTLVYSLLPPPGPTAPDSSPGEPWSPSLEEAAVQDEVVGALEKVLLLVPTAGSRALPLLLANMPHKLRPRGTQCLYLRAVFSLAERRAGAGVREGLLAGVVEHLTSIDVEIRWEDIMETVTEEAKEEEGGMPPADDEEPDIFELEGMSELDLVNGGAQHHANGCAAEAVGRGGWEGGGRIKPATPPNKEAPEGAKPPQVDETADKLDSMMEQTLEHLGKRVAAGQLAAAWDTLAGAFERTVLQTHRSKFVQFVMFYACRQAPEPCCRGFLALLLTRLTDAHQPPITRSACAAYVASFLARAAYVPEHLVVECLQRLVDWCVKYTRDEDRRGGLPPIPSGASLQSLSGDAAARHAAFFATVQAVLYVLCYHMEPLLRPRAAEAPAALQALSLDGSSAAAVPSTASTATAVAAAAVAGAGAGHGSGVATPPTAPGGPPGVAIGLQQQGRGDAGSPYASHSPHHGQQQNLQHQQQQQREACAAAVQALLSSCMPRLVSHSLDPLSSCAKSVVLEFARQARSLGLEEVSRSIKDWERKQANPATSSHRPRPLEMFFPFDPYLLRRSATLLDLDVTYVVWRRGHPAGAVRADLESDSDSESEGEEIEEEEELEGGSDMSDGDKVEAASGGEESSGLSSGDDSSDSSESDAESEDLDDLRRTRFGSMPESFPSSGGSGRGRRGLHHNHSSRHSNGHAHRPHLPGALKASLAHGNLGAGSPTMGFQLPGGSYSTDGMGSPYGSSPYGPYGTSFGVAPMSCTPTR